MRAGPTISASTGLRCDNVFEVVAAGGSSASFSLKSNPELKKKYPFDFEFIITYRLQGMTLAVEYEVMNRGNSMMFFSVGSHEAYRCPLVDGERFEDYTIQLNQNERLDRYYLEERPRRLTGEPFIRTLGRSFRSAMNISVPARPCSRTLSPRR